MSATVKAAQYILSALILLIRRGVKRALVKADSRHPQTVRISALYLMCQQKS
jgi:hypothetical protein